MLLKYFGSSGIGLIWNVGEVLLDDPASSSGKVAAILPGSVRERPCVIPNLNF